MKKIIWCIGAAVIILLSGCSKEYKPSDHTGFSVIESPNSNADVVMYFWYRCPACYKAEREISEWAEQTGRSVEFRHSSIWEEDARLFYTLDLAGVAQKYQSELMTYFRRSSNPTLKGIEQVINEELEESFIESRLDSPYVNNLMDAARRYETRVGSTGVPLIIVKNQYAIVDDGLANITSTIEYILKNAR